MSSAGQKRQRAGTVKQEPGVAGAAAAGGGGATAAARSGSGAAAPKATRRRTDGSTRVKVEVKKEGQATGTPATAAGAGQCPYLDTVDRSLLDFDVEPVCSVTMSKENVYMCLVCGQYFRGKAASTPAFTHSVQANHYVWFCPERRTFHCLPDNYQIADSSLRDIAQAYDPAFTPKEAAAAATSSALARTLRGEPYLPGFVPVNASHKGSEAVAVCCQLLAHIPELRSFFLADAPGSGCTSALVQSVGRLVRRLWSRHNFRPVLTPFEVAEEVARASKRRFGSGAPATEAIDPLAWLIHTLHTDLLNAYPKASQEQRRWLRARRLQPGFGGGRSPGGSAVSEALEGAVECSTQRIVPVGLAGDEKQADDPAVAAEWAGCADGVTDEASVRRFHSKRTVPFRFLRLEMPAAPVFQDQDGEAVIPQLALEALLSKFDGETVTETLQGEVRVRRRMRLARLPRTLLLQLRRFSVGARGAEKNPSLVRFPVDRLDMEPYCSPLQSEQAVESLSVAELRTLCDRQGISTKQIVEKPELVAAARRAQAAASSTTYTLLGNLCHDSPSSQERSDRSGPGDPIADGRYRLHLSDTTGQWHELSDAHVSDLDKEALGLSESYLLAYRRVE